MKTILHIELPVNKRKKPDDYHYANDDEVISLRDRVTELEQLVQNGDSIYVKKGDQNSGTSCNYTASATGSMSFASGTLTKSSGSNSLTSGSESIASATNAVAFGEKNVASGINSSAHGESTQAQGDNSATFGYKTVVNGFAAIAEGNNTQAISPSSHAAGEGTIASGASNQFVIGQYNEKDEDGKYLFIIGNGTYDNSTKEETRKNVFTVGKNGSIAGGNGCVANGENSVAFGQGCESNGQASFACGGATASYGDFSFAFGENVLTRQRNQFAIGKYNTDDQNGKFAFAIGNGGYDSDSKTTTRSNAIAIDWQGKIYVNNSDTGVDVLDLLNRVKALEEAVIKLS